MAITNGTATLMRELADAEFRRQHAEHREFRESLTDLPIVPNNCVYRSISVETVPWSQTEIVLRIAIGDECHTRAVSITDMATVQAYAGQFQYARWDAKLMAVAQ